MTSSLLHSVYCFATDVLDEGAATVLDNVALRAQVRSVTVAVKYHSVSDVYPHNPVRRVATFPPGVFYHPDLTRYAAHALLPRVSPVAAGRDVLGELCTAAEQRDMDVAAWAVLLHHDDSLPGGVGLQTNCFGDELAGTLCPAHPEARRFAELIVGELADYPLDTVRLESLHFHGIAHGHHHERLLEHYGDAAIFLLGLCFCRWCRERSESEGIDAAKLAESARNSLERAFDSSALPRDLTADALVDMCGENILDYLRAREHSVTSLTARLVDVARRTSTRLSFIDPTIASQTYATGTCTGDAMVAHWQFGIDVTALRSTGATVEITGYLRERTELGATLAQYQDADEDAGTLAVILRPGRPDCESADELREKVATATEAGSSEVNFYNYGLYRLGALDLIGSAIAGVRDRKPHVTPASP